MQVKSRRWGDGADFEEEFLGKSRHDIMRSHPHLSTMEIRNLLGSMSHLKNLQYRVFNWNPRRPRTELAKAFFCEIKGNLRGRGILLCSAIGTALDWKGIDCWVELEGNNRKFVTIDLTTNPRKRFSGADLVLSLQDFQVGQYVPMARHVAGLLLR